MQSMQSVTHVFIRLAPMSPVCTPTRGGVMNFASEFYLEIKKGKVFSFPCQYNTVSLSACERGFRLIRKLCKCMFICNRQFGKDLAVNSDG